MCNKKDLILMAIDKGDPSVGIWQSSIEVNLHNFEFDQEEREEIMTRFHDFANGILDTVDRMVFNDQCSECLSLLDEYGQCPDKGCITNYDEDRGELKK